VSTNGQGSFNLSIAPQGYRFRADKAGTQFWSAGSNDCAVPGCSGVTVALVPTSGMAPDGLLTLTAYQPGSDTLVIPADWIMPACLCQSKTGPLDHRKEAHLKPLDNKVIIENRPT